jgi:hypothetical protein
VPLPGNKSIWIAEKPQLNKLQTGKIEENDKHSPVHDDPLGLLAGLLVETDEVLPANGHTNIKEKTLTKSAMNSKRVQLSAKSPHAREGILHRTISWLMRTFRYRTNRSNW